jgi:hypothetical protein
MKTNEDQSVAFSSTLEAANEQFVRSRDYIKHLTSGAVLVCQMLEKRDATLPENRKSDFTAISEAMPSLVYYDQYAERLQELENMVSRLIENEYYMTMPDNFRSRMLENLIRMGGNISLEMGWAKELLGTMLQEFGFGHPDFDRSVQPPQ